jgi:hypothetical protein
MPRLKAASTKIYPRVFSKVHDAEVLIALTAILAPHRICRIAMHIDKQDPICHGQIR